MKIYGLKLVMQQSMVAWFLVLLNVHLHEMNTTTG